MARTMETPEAEYLAGGESNMLSTPGTYHFLVEDIKDGEMPSSDDVLEGFSVRLKVLEGDQKDNIAGMIFPDGSAHKDGGKFARLKQTAFLVAANVLKPSDLNGGSVAYDEQNARSAQIVAELVPKENADGTKSDKFLDFKYANIYHVDDPRAASVAKSAEALEMIPKEFRHDESFFSVFAKRKQKQGGETQPPKDTDFGGL